MKAIMITVRLWWFYLTYKGIKKIEVRKRFAKDFKGKIFEYVSKTNWKKDLMKIPEEEREFFKQFVGKVGLCFECDKVETIMLPYTGFASTQFVFNEAQRTLQTKTLDEKDILKLSCLTEDEIYGYLNFKNSPTNVGCAIHINDLKPFDKPKEIKEFKHIKLSLYFNEDSSGGWKEELEPLTRAPQNYYYIEV